MRLAWCELPMRRPSLSRSCLPLPFVPYADLSLSFLMPSLPVVGQDRGSHLERAAIRYGKARGTAFRNTISSTSGVRLVEPSADPTTPPPPINLPARLGREGT